MDIKGEKFILDPKEVQAINYSGGAYIGLEFPISRAAELFERAENIAGSLRRTMTEIPKSDFATVAQRGDVAGIIHRAEAIYPTVQGMLSQLVEYVSPDEVMAAQAASFLEG